MSWTLSVPKSPKAEFDAAVDAAVPFGQSIELPGVAEDVAEAKAALKLLGARVKRENVVGGADGHSLQPEDGRNFSDSLSVNVYGAE